MNNEIDLDPFKVFNELLSPASFIDNVVSHTATNSARLKVIHDVTNINSL